MSKVEHEKLIKKDWVGQVYSASEASGGRGVAILVLIETVQSDPERCYAMIQGYLDVENIIILKVYAPPNSPPSFFTLLAEVTSSYIAPNIINGDWNCILNSNLDQSPQVKGLSNNSKTIAKIIHEMG